VREKVRKRRDRNRQKVYRSGRKIETERVCRRKRDREKLEPIL